MKKRNLNRFSPGLVAALTVGAAAMVFVSACKRSTDLSTGSADMTAAEPPEARAELSSTEGFRASGTVTFVRVADGVEVVANLSGLAPGEHGFHIHEYGDCSAPDASSAGGHFNPTDQPHGSPMSEAHHVGDLGNIRADDAGNAHLKEVFSALSLSGPNSIIGKAVIVHSGADDLTSQPSGNAGKRVACGVITESSAR